MELILLDLPDESQIDFQIALVDEPAIESNFHVFKKDFETRYQFKEFDKSRKLLMGYFMIADLPIPRYDNERGNFNVVFPRPSIDKIVRNFSTNGLNRNMNEMHQTGKLLDGVYVLHHWQLDSKLDIKAPKGFTQEADGSWFGVVRCENEEVYQKALEGKVKGFSIEGRFFEHELFRAKVDAFFDELSEIINTSNK